MTLFYFTFTLFNVDGSQICDSGTNFQYAVMFIILCSGLWYTKYPVCRDTVYAGTYCPIFVGEVQYTILFPKKNAVLIARPYGHLKCDRTSLVCQCEHYVYLLPNLSRFCK